MPLMRRRLLIAVSVLSLVLCAATVVLWVRGQRLPMRYWRQTFQSRGAVYGQDAFDNMRGVVAVCHFRGQITDPGSIAICERAASKGSYRWSRLDWMAIPAPTSFWERRGLYFRVAHEVPLSVNGPKAAIYYVGAPHWLLVFLTAVLPGYLLATVVRRLRSRGPGMCSSCGYNLTGNTSGVCPECGTPKTVGTADEPPLTALAPTMRRRHL
jgi:hypothetical protein